MRVERYTADEIVSRETSNPRRPILGQSTVDWPRVTSTDDLMYGDIFSDADGQILYCIGRSTSERTWKFVRLPASVIDLLVCGCGVVP